MELTIIKDTNDLEQLEGVIQKNLQSFYDVGRALVEIRDRELYKIKNGYIIKDGHHRLFVAKKLNIPVCYVVCHDNADIRKLNDAIKPRDRVDYMTSYCRSGVVDYLKAKDYIDETGMPLGLALSILMGHTAGSVKWRERFKSGEYKINRDSDHASIMKEIILLCKAAEIGFYITCLSRRCPVSRV